MVLPARVGVMGASGYVGGELLRLLASHPQLDVVVATGDSSAGKAVASQHSSLAAAYRDMTLSPTTAEVVDGLDIVFCALPHGASAKIMPELTKAVGKVIDLGADFRLKDSSLYPQWYGAEHPCPELLPDAVYGLPELDRSSLLGASLIAVPGCYVTAAVLALAPLVAAGVIEPSGIVVDAASGVSGAGRKLAESTHFCTTDESFSAYGLLTHRHTPEIEQGVKAQVIFTPHLVPMNRGILATCYGRYSGAGDPLEVLADAYRDEPFIVVDERLPATKAVMGSNVVHLSARRDERTGWVVALSALDNLVKGAAGQAVQCANAAQGWPETTGLALAGMAP